MKINPKMTGKRKVLLDTTTPVIALPDGIAEAAAKVLENSNIPTGDTSPAHLPKSSDLLEAATDPAKALQADAIEDAVFEDLPPSIPPQSDAELAAEVLLEPASEVDHPSAPIWDAKDAEALQDVTSVKPYKAVSEAGCKILAWAEDIGPNLARAGGKLKKGAAKVGAKLESFGARILVGVWDFIKMTGNKAWKLHDYLKKNPTAPYEWLTGLQHKFFGLFKNKTADAIRELSQHILDLKATHEADIEGLREVHATELRRMSKRINELEATLNKKIRASDKASLVDTEQLTKLVKATTAGRKAEAASLIRSIAGVSLADAKGMIN